MFRLITVSCAFVQTAPVRGTVATVSPTLITGVPTVGGVEQVEPTVEKAPAITSEARTASLKVRTTDEGLEATGAVAGVNVDIVGPSLSTVTGELLADSKLPVKVVLIKELAFTTTLKVPFPLQLPSVTVVPESVRPTRPTVQLAVPVATVPILEVVIATFCALEKATSMVTVALADRTVTAEGAEKSAVGNMSGMSLMIFVSGVSTPLPKHPEMAIAITKDKRDFLLSVFLILKGFHELLFLATRFKKA
jgi:hypothetical protein